VASDNEKKQDNFWSLGSIFSRVGKVLWDVTIGGFQKDAQIIGDAANGVKNTVNTVSKVEQTLDNKKPLSEKIRLWAKPEDGSSPNFFQNLMLFVADVVEGFEKNGIGGGLGALWKGIGNAFTQMTGGNKQENTVAPQPDAKPEATQKNGPVPSPLPAPTPRKESGGITTNVDASDAMNNVVNKQEQTPPVKVQEPQKQDSNMALLLTPGAWTP
jgi:hypothetical protein